MTKEQFPTYEQLAEGWKQMQAERDQVRGNLSRAEEGLANYALEVKRQKAALVDAWNETQTASTEIQRLQAESDAWDKLSLVQLSQENQRLKQQLIDTKDDYLRRHNDAVDRYEEIERLKAELQT